jgi:hypothetical protein
VGLRLRTQLYVTWLRSCSLRAAQARLASTGRATLLSVQTVLSMKCGKIACSQAGGQSGDQPEKTAGEKASQEMEKAVEIIDHAAMLVERSVDIGRARLSKMSSKVGYGSEALTSFLDSLSTQAREAATQPYDRLRISRRPTSARG